jgi:hypothetical protein
MTINSLKELQKLIALCRRTGVQQIRVDGIELYIGEEPVKVSRSRQKPQNVTNEVQSVTLTPGGVTEETKIPGVTAASDWDMLTEEQKMFWSARPEDPSHETM